MKNLCNVKACGMAVIVKRKFSHALLGIVPAVNNSRMGLVGDKGNEDKILWAAHDSTSWMSCLPALHCQFLIDSFENLSLDR